MALVCEPTGLKLGEKKELKETHMPEWEKFASTIVSKLGSGWKVVVEMGKFTEHVPETDSNRRYLMGYLKKKLSALADEFGKLDGDLIEAFNDSCKTKQIILTLGGKSADYPAGRYGVAFGDNITITCASDLWYMDYPYSDAYTVSALALKHF